jgi:hypothetical protein
MPLPQPTSTAFTVVAGSSVASSPRQPRVVPCVPVPKARPASMRTIAASAAARPPQLAVPRHDQVRAPKRSGTYWSIHAFPILVLDLAEARPSVEFVVEAQCREQDQRIGVVGKHMVSAVRPQRQFADAGLEDRLLVRRIRVRVGERDRECADVFQRAFIKRLLASVQGGKSRKG